MLSVRESYWRAKAAQALAALYAQDADYFRQVIDYHEARFHEGKIAEVDLLRVRLQGEQIRAAAANARLDSEKALLMLAQEMNAAANSAWVLSEDFETLEVPKLIPAGTDVESLRTEGQLAQQAISKAEAQTRLVKANGRPDLLFTGGYKRDLNLDSPVAGVQFDLPLFNRNQGAVAAAHAEEDALRESYQARPPQMPLSSGTLAAFGCWPPSMLRLFLSCISDRQQQLRCRMCRMQRTPEELRILVRSSIPVAGNETQYLSLYKQVTTPKLLCDNSLIGAG